MSRVPSDLQVVELVRAYLHLHSFSLSEAETLRLIEVAKFLWSHPQQCLHPKDLHEQVFKGGVDAGSYRLTMPVNVSGQSRRYPRPTLVPRLMVQLFSIYYASAVSGPAFERCVNPSETSQYVGAILRCIRPFNAGNRVLSWLYEGQILLLHDMLPSLEVWPKREFDKFRRDTFEPMKLVIIG